MRKSAQRITLIKDITLAIADCKYRAPLPPRLYDRFLLYYKFFHFSRCFLIYFLSDCDDFCFAGHGTMWHRPLQGTGGVRCFLLLTFARHGRCQMFFVVDVCTARTVSDVFCCWHLHGTDGVRCFLLLTFARHGRCQMFFVVGVCTGADGGGYFLFAFLQASPPAYYFL